MILFVSLFSVCINCTVPNLLELEKFTGERKKKQKFKICVIYLEASSIANKITQNI